MTEYVHIFARLLSICAILLGLYERYQGDDMSAIDCNIAAIMLWLLSL